ncbi:MAG: hypothetical protein K2P81_07380 [Bacteriovoracaceae bacterium]|nr:hypothetical protein [Bacteriovoracaceae bacterium]
MMRNILFLASLLFAVCANAQDNPLNASSELISSPTAFSLVSSVLSGYQDRGVAGIEQLRDELPALHADLLAGAIKEIDDVRQPAIKELFEDIARNDDNIVNLKKAYPGRTLLAALTLKITSELIQ